MDLSRRALIGGIAGLAVATQFDVNPAAAFASVPFGVCTHSTFRNSVYADDAKISATVRDLGARYVRDMLGIGSFDQTSLFTGYRDAGIRMHLTVGIYGKTTIGDREKYRQRLLAVADCVDSVAGWNEPDGSASLSTWLPPTVDHQKWLWAMVKGDPALAHITVLPGALRDKNPNLASDLGALYQAIRGYYDIPNLHVYPGTKDPRTYLAERLAMVPGGHAWITEGGGSTAKMTEARQAYISTELVNAQAERGDRCYVYELMDDAGTDLQSKFGVYNNDFSRKSVAVALRSL